MVLFYQDPRLFDPQFLSKLFLIIVAGIVLTHIFFYISTAFRWNHIHTDFKFILIIRKG